MKSPKVDVDWTDKTKKQKLICDPISQPIFILFKTLKFISRRFQQNMTCIFTIHFYTKQAELKICSVTLFSQKCAKLSKNEFSFMCKRYDKVLTQCH